MVLIIIVTYLKIKHIDYDLVGNRYLWWTLKTTVLGNCRLYLCVPYRLRLLYHNRRLYVFYFQLQTFSSSCFLFHCSHCCLLCDISLLSFLVMCLFLLCFMLFFILYVFSSFIFLHFKCWTSWVPKFQIVARLLPFDVVVLNFEALELPYQVSSVIIIFNEL